MLITFEGIEGSGKSTQVERLARRLEAAGRTVVRTREPGGTEVADEIRAIFLRPRIGPLAGEVELFLVLAARAAHVRERVEPALKAGAVVLCDRYADATVAYQGYGRGVDLDLIRSANDLATGGRSPDWTVLLDLPAEAGLARARARNERSAAGQAEARIDAEGLEFHRRVRRGYLELAEAFPARFSLVDASRDEATVEGDVAREAAQRGLFPTESSPGTAS